MSQHNISLRQARWLNTLADFDYKLQHIPRNKKIMANWISRNPDPKTNETQIDIHHDHVCTTSSIQQSPELLKQTSDSYENDPYFAKITKNNDSLSQITKNGDPPLLYLKIQLCIPDVKNICQQNFHDHRNILGHFGTRKTLSPIADNYYWANLTKELDTYIEQCENCQRNKTSNQKPKDNFSHLTYHKMNANMPPLTGSNPSCHSQTGSSHQSWA